MRLGLVLFLVVCRVALATPPEDDANRLVSEGARLGEAGDLEGAIARFRQAERVFPRAIHDCNLGLAYAMGRRHAQAYALLARCAARATGPLPAWVDVERRRTLDALSRGPYTSLVVSASGPATARVETLLADDDFALPATFWLPVGAHRIVVTAPGHRPEVRTLTVTGAGAQRLEVTLQAATVVTAARTAEPEDGVEERAPLVVPPAPEPPDRVAGWSVLTTGLVTVAVGAVMHGLAVSSGDAIATRTYPDAAAADGDLEVFQLQRGVAIGAYSAGAVLLGTGLGLLLWPSEAP